jgi:hypothetical protein
VRYPPATAFGATTRARAAAAATLGRDIIDELRPTRPGSLTVASIEEARTRVLQRALAKIPSAETLEAVRNSIEPFAGKVILCLRAEAAPQIDGQLDDACWKLAPVYSDFAQHGSGKSPSYRTEIRLVHDSDRLYVAFQCYQDTGALLAWTRERDGRVWREDGVEFLLNRPTDTTERQRLQIIVSTRGNLFDYYDGSETWNGDIAVQTRIEPTFYAIELGIPVKAIGIDPAQNRFLRVNFVRNVYARKDLSGGEPKEISNWYLTPFSNLDPKARGWVIFN